MATVKELLDEAEFRKCAGDFFYWCEKYAYIRHPERGKIKFDLFEAQRETIEQVLERENLLILKARQLGWSTLFAVYGLWATFFASDRQIIFLSKTEREAQKLIAKSKYTYKYLPQWMKDRGPSLTTNHVQKMPFNNDSSIEAMPSKSEPARGESVWLVIVDEWAFLDNPEDAWASIEPIADVGGQIIGLSTAKGWGNFFHTMWVRATTGASNFNHKFYPWSAREDRTKEWYEAKERELPAWQLHQEYPRNADEAFIKSGNPAFDSEMLAAMQPTQPHAIGYIHEFGPKNYEFREGKNGSLWVWEHPIQGEAYVIGADTSEGLEHGDYSAAHVINVRSGLVAAVWHGHIDADLWGEELARLGWWYNTALVGVESNNHGLTTLKALQRVFYTKIYKQRRLTSKSENETDQLGWRTTKSSKPLMIDELNKALREKSIHLGCERTLGELRTYVRDPDGRMHGSPFDDRVIALAIANQMLAHAYLPEYSQVKDDYMTGVFWERVLEESQEKSDAWVIGGRGR